MTPDPAIVALAERHLVAASMKGRRLARFVEDDLTWWMDLDEDIATVGPRTFGVDVIGTASYNDDSWVWAWDNPSFDDRHVRSALRLRELGEREGIARLTADGSLPLTTMDPELAGIIAGGEARAPGCLVGGYEHEGRGAIVLLLHGDELAREPYTGMDLAGALGDVTGAPVNHRAAVRGFAEAPEPGFEVIDAGDAEARFAGPDGTVLVRFDGAGRITEVRGDLGPAR